MDERVVLALAQEKADWRVVSIGNHVTFVPAYVRIELAKILVTEIGDFQLNQYVALQYPVIENEINETDRVTDLDALLSRLEAESMAELEHEGLQAIEQRVFEIRFAHHFWRSQAQELEYIRITKV